MVSSTGTTYRSCSCGPAFTVTGTALEGQESAIIDQVLEEMIERCGALNLRLDRPLEQAQRDALVLVTVQTMNYLHGGYHQVAL
ncbi:MAG: hypothetical protein IID42_05070 [Planctomycetes bacterium]|nr:hypothetical protein [Planctomycetota bacterium]